MHPCSPGGLGAWVRGWDASLRKNTRAGVSGAQADVCAVTGAAYGTGVSVAGARPSFIACWEAGSAVDVHLLPVLPGEVS